jgi:hypothetical protein
VTVTKNIESESTRSRHAHERETRDTTRIQLDLAPASLERLRFLKEQLEAASYAEVIREALKVFEFLVREEQKGSSVVVQPQGDSATALKLIL